MKRALRYAAWAFAFGAAGTWIVGALILALSYGIRWIEEKEERCQYWNDCMGAIPFDFWFRGCVVVSLFFATLAASVVFVAEITGTLMILGFIALALLSPIILAYCSIYIWWSRRCKRLEETQDVVSWHP